MSSDAYSVLRAIDKTVEAIKARCSAHWIVAYSGGKDSTAALKIFLAAYNKAESTTVKLTVVYCDTGVENPILDRYAKHSIDLISDEIAKINSNFSVRLMKSPVTDRFCKNSWTKLSTTNE